MALNLFEDQRNLRRENDEKVFSGAFAELASILGADAVRHSSQSEAAGAMKEIFDALGVRAVKVPEELEAPEERIAYMLRASGVMRRRVELSGEWWRDAAGCLLGSTVDGNLVAILPKHISGYQYRGKDGSIVTVDKNTAKTLNTDAFCFYRPLPAKALTWKDLTAFLIRSLSGSDVLFVLAASLLVALAGLLVPFINSLIFRVVLPSGIEANILPMAALLIGAAAGTTLFGVVRSAVLTRFRDKMNLSVQSAMMMRVLSLPAGFFKEYSSGELSNRILIIGALCTAIANTVLSALLTAVFSCVYIFQMAAYAPALTGPVLLIPAAQLLFLLLVVFIQTGIRRKQLRISAKLSGLVYSLFSGIQKIKLAGAEKRAFAKWAAGYAAQGKLSFAPPVIVRLYTAISLLLTAGSGVVVFWLAARSGVAPADFMAFQAAYGALGASLAALSAVALTAASVRPAMEMAAPILEAVPETNSDKKIVRSLSGGIELNNVTFRYAKDAPTVLDGLSLKVRAGEYVAFTGKSGCGKSTLFRLLLGFEKPELGAVYYDGQDLATLDPVSVRRCMGVVLQNGKLISGDIYSNIVLTAPDKTLDDAWEAAEMAGVADDIRAMPMGMHTMISEGGGGVSGGQRQRILIARAIVSKPRIVLFDEATSALDNLTQQHVSDSLLGLKCTRLVIAHRLSTIRNADRIVVLDGGRVAESGNYETLMAKKGIFYELAKRQTI